MAKAVRTGLITAVAGAIIGIPAWLLRGKPSFDDVVEAWHVRFAPQADSTHFTMLVADLVGDDDERSQTFLLLSTLEEIPGLDVQGYGDELSYSRVGDLGDNIAAAESKGREWLERRQADLLIWGRVVRDSLQIRFLPREIGGGLGAYPRLGSELTLPAGFSTDLGDQVVAIALTSVSPATEAAGTHLVTVLRPVTLKLRSLLDSGETFSDQQRADLNHSFGLAAATIGEQSGDAMALEEAVVAFRAVLEEWTRDRVPLDWAATQNNLGGTLAILGERESGTERLEEAVVASRAALEVYTQAGHQPGIAGVGRNLDHALELPEGRRQGVPIP